MPYFFKNILFVCVFIASVTVQAHGLEKGDPVVSKSKEELSKEEGAVDYKEVQDVFMKIKRVDNLLSPKKKLRKKKYTIA